MLIDGELMTDEELDLHTKAIMRCIHALLETADKMNLDRDSYMKAATAQLNTMAEISTFERYDLKEK